MSSDLHKFFLLIVVVSAVFCLIKYTLVYIIYIVIHLINTLPNIALLLKLYM
uniref:Hypotheticial protein n=1 Tax=Schistosoma japonicum TaxID=6182 RepID=C7TY04_SCHJA|nr:hypotheticial protein [Schistosoma japonicum]CAX82482.1 hypotheticial protein [Schistosoma japonicum]